VDDLKSLSRIEPPGSEVVPRGYFCLEEADIRRDPQIHDVPFEVSINAPTGLLNMGCGVNDDFLFRCA
jgi:hypothetical protein